jgi:hypothetical protein
VLEPLDATPDGLDPLVALGESLDDGLRKAVDTLDQPILAFLERHEDVGHASQDIGGLVEPLVGAIEPLVGLTLGALDP